MHLINKNTQEANENVNLKTLCYNHGIMIKSFGQRHLIRINTIFRPLCFLIPPAFLCVWLAFSKTLQLDNNYTHEQNLVFKITISQSFTDSDEVIIKNESFPSNKTHEKLTIGSDSQNDCFLLNSRDWIDGERLGNSNDVDNAMALRMILNIDSPLSKSSQSLLRHSFCTSDSQFNNIYNASSERTWLIRLVYLSIHAHQHNPALRESEQRRVQNFTKCGKELQNRNISSFDYECPEAKFLVISLYKNGIGANLRLAAVPALMAGLATNRIVLFVNNAPAGMQFMQSPWTLSSCIRRDYQCFFLPISPCVITTKELQIAYVLQKNEMRRIFRTGEVPENHKNDRVLVMHLTFRPQRFPQNLGTVLHHLATSQIDNISIQSARNGVLKDEKQLLLLHTLKVASDRLLKSPEETPSFNYYGAGSPIFHGLLLYALRPNPKSESRIESVLREILPPDFDPDNSVGIPIRASDKCGVESECLTFQQHLSAAQEMWQTSHATIQQQTAENQTSPLTFLVTTESQEIRAEFQNQVALSSNGGHESVPFRLYTNHLDVTQNTGYLEHENNINSTYTADDAMLSAMSSLKAQLMTKLTLGNCCSNFHLLLKDLLEEGCGSATVNHFRCLQEHDNPEYRVCCAWNKSAECRNRRQHNEATISINNTVPI